jgi:hypothetical protein
MIFGPNSRPKVPDQCIPARAACHPAIISSTSLRRQTVAGRPNGPYAPAMR